MPTNRHNSNNWNPCSTITNVQATCTNLRLLTRFLLTKPPRNPNSTSSRNRNNTNVSAPECPRPRPHGIQQPPRPSLRPNLNPGPKLRRNPFSSSKLPRALPTRPSANAVVRASTSAMQSAHAEPVSSKLPGDGSTDERKPSAKLPSRRVTRDKNRRTTP